MAYEQRDMNGSLFKNKKREKDTHPNSQGSCRIDGVDFWISGWTKTDKNGDPWISLAFKRKEEQKTDAPSDRQRAETAVQEMDEDVPF